jgi:maltokinase
VTALDDVLSAWVPQQRWYGAKGRPVTSVSAALLGEAREGGPADLVPAVVEVTLDHGEVQRYQVPLSRRASPWDDIGHALVGEADGAWYYDAPHDPDAAALLLDDLIAQKALGSLSFHRIGDISEGLHPRLVGVEQSNTSLVFGEEMILKIFRRLSPGTNPDLEVTRALQEAGSPHIAPVCGWYDAPVGGVPTTLGVAQAFAASASEGWSMATASVRDLYAEGDLHADEVGGDFAGEAHRLGVATAEVHGLLADVLPTATAGPDEAHATASQMRDRLDRAVAEVPDLAPYADGLASLYTGVADIGAVATQRVHGDYHLGQVLRTGAGWLLLDFEGEPARPLEERTALMSPLRDVAGMLRSFTYAARSLLTDHTFASGGLEYRAGEWADRNRSAFCDGYAAAAGRDPRDDALLLQAFEADKAVYEVVYEARHRPTWLTIPLSSIESLVS